MSRCPSSVYNSQPFSQSQKMSIGIVVDSATPRLAKESGFSNIHAAVAEKEASGTRRVTVKRNVGQGADASAANTTVKHTDQSKKRKSSSTLSGVQPTHSFQTARNEALLEHGVGRKRDTDHITQKEGKVSRTDRRAEDLSSLRKQVCMPVVGEAQDQTGVMEVRSKETLRMNLRQILGTSPFSYDKVDDAMTRDASTHEMLQAQNAKGDRHSKPRQDSDTIETDSDNVSLATDKPVTRSAARNKVPAARRTRNLKPKSLTCDKETKQGNNISSFAKKPMPSQSHAVNHGSLMTERTDSAKKSYGIKPGDLLSPITDLRKSNIQPLMTGGEETTPVKEIPLCSVTQPAPSHACLNENIEVTLQDVNLNNSPVISEKHQLQDSENPILQEKSEHHESFGFRTPAPQDDISESPLCKMKRNVLKSPLGLFSVNDKMQHVHRSLHEAGLSILEDKCLSTSSSTTANDSGSSDDTATPDNIHTNAQNLSVEDNDVDDGIFTPGKGESDSAEEASSMKRGYMENVQTSPEIGLVEKPLLFMDKRCCSRDVYFNDSSPGLTAPKSGGKMNDLFMEASEINADDGLTRVISLLGLALEKVKSEMAMMADRRCQAILMSSAEEIHSQLQDVESQIQTDLGKLTCIKISKRKHLETRLQEQQEHLKGIHEKFKEEILRYLQDCRGAVEGLEKQHIELKGAIETQKASHRKLVLQAEAVVENHIVETQRKIMSVHKIQEKKMQQLKVAIVECLKDVMLGEHRP